MIWRFQLIENITHKKQVNVLKEMQSIRNQVRRRKPASVTCTRQNLGLRAAQLVHLLPTRKLHVSTEKRSDSPLQKSFSFRSSIQVPRASQCTEDRDYTLGYITQNELSARAPPKHGPPRVPPHKTASPNNKGRRLDVLSLVKYSTKKFHIGPVLKYKEMLLRRLWKTRRFSCNYARHFKMSTAASRREHAHKHDVCTWTCGASEPSNAQQTRLGLPSSGTPRGSKCTV